MCLQLKDEITMKVQEVDREARRKTKLEKDLAALRKELEAQNGELKNKQVHAQKLEEECQKLEHDLKNSKVGWGGGVSREVGTSEGIGSVHTVCLHSTYVRI